MSADSVGSVSAALRVISRQSAYPFDLDLRLDAATGAEQVFQIKTDRSEGDFAVMGSPSSAINMGERRIGPYRLVAVLHYLPLVLLARDQQIATILLAQGGFAELFGRYYDRKGHMVYERSFAVEYEKGFSPLRLASDLPSGVGILAFDPAATALTRKHRLRKVQFVRCKRGIRPFRYGVHVCLFVNTNHFNPGAATHQNEQLADQFIRGFLYEYLQCQTNQYDAIDILTECVAFRHLYAISAGYSELVWPKMGSVGTEAGILTTDSLEAFALLERFRAANAFGAYAK